MGVLPQARGRKAAPTIAGTNSRLVSGQILTLKGCTALAHMDREEGRVSVAVAMRTNKLFTDVQRKLLGKGTASQE